MPLLAHLGWSQSLSILSETGLIPQGAQGAQGAHGGGAGKVVRMRFRQPGLSNLPDGNQLFIKVDLPLCPNASVSQSGPDWGVKERPSPVLSQRDIRMTGAPGISHDTDRTPSLPFKWLNLTPPDLGLKYVIVLY